MAIETVPTGPLPFFGINPCRLLDTRPPANNPLDGDGIYLTDEIRTYTLTGACGLPGGAQAVSLNVTATNTGSGAFGHIKIWPSDQAEPNVSTLNYPGAGATVANAAIVPLSNTGAIKVKSGNAGADVILDVNGYYAPIAIVNTLNGLSGAVTLAAGTNVSITPSGNTLTIANTAPTPPAAWQLTGNAGTTPGTNFLGTTDSQPLEIKVNNQRVMRYEPHVTSPNVVGGFSGNSVTATVYGATIAGGGQNLGENRVTDIGGTVAGGIHNQAGDNAGTPFDRLYATVGGGLNNTASGSATTVAGGNGNTATGIQGATVGGGNSNTASGATSTVVGGEFNTASGGSSTVAGGYNNTAAGLYSFAAGRQVQANHDGTFVWGDTSFVVPPMASTGVNQFIVRSAGGIWLGATSSPSFDITTDFLRTSTGAHLTIGGVWTDNSDVNSKENFREIDRRDVLARLASLPITRWNYKAEGCDVEHLGPMAQDFSAAFGLGSDRSISTLDSSGVALAAIQALYEEVRELRRRLEALECGKD